MAKKDKSRQKKFDTRIDFTPMVDMNMLLITFFMLCTTMLKSQTLDLALPTNDKVDKEEETKIQESNAITFILDATVDKTGQKANALQKYIADHSDLNLCGGIINVVNGVFYLNDSSEYELGDGKTGQWKLFNL